MFNQTINIMSTLDLILFNQFHSFRTFLTSFSPAESLSPSKNDGGNHGNWNNLDSPDYCKQS